MKIKFNTELVDAYMTEHEIGRIEFCRRAKITTRDFAKIMEHNFHGVRLDVYILLADILGASVDDLTVRMC